MVPGTYGNVDEAFAGLDAMRERMRLVLSRLVGSSPDCIELLVMDPERRVVNRGNAVVDRLTVIEGPAHRTMASVTKED